MREIAKISQQAISKNPLLPAEFSAWGWCNQTPMLKSVHLCISITPLATLVQVNNTWDTMRLKDMLHLNTLKNWMNLGFGY